MGKKTPAKSTPPLKKPERKTSAARHAKQQKPKQKVQAGKILRKKLDFMLENEDVDLDTVIGPVLANDLKSTGVTSLRQLRSKDPEKLYQQIISRRGKHVDRCVLYTYRCGRYVARTPAKSREEELLLWYSWTDSKLPDNAEELLACPIERLSKSVMNKRAADARREGRGSDGPNKITRVKEEPPS
eukprot:scpid85519/ scgid13193/ 